MEGDLTEFASAKCPLCNRRPRESAEPRTYERDRRQNDDVRRRGNDAEDSTEMDSIIVSLRKVRAIE